jgi:hypothetical protein
MIKGEETECNKGKARGYRMIKERKKEKEEMLTYEAAVKERIEKQRREEASPGHEI